MVDGVELTLPSARRPGASKSGKSPRRRSCFTTPCNNLRWAAPHVTDRDVAMALSAAAADEFVRRLPLGLDTLVGDRGVLLSGGERQRLALARAAAQAAAADSGRSHQLARFAERARDPGGSRGLRGDVAILLIAHRLSSVRQADMIYVLEAGRVVETGNWDQLMARTGGRFRALCLAQGSTVRRLALRRAGCGGVGLCLRTADARLASRSWAGCTVTRFLSTCRWSSRRSAWAGWLSKPAFRFPSARCTSSG